MTMKDDEYYHWNKTYHSAICIKNSPNRFRIDHFFTPGRYYQLYSYQNAITEEVYYKIINDKGKLKSFQKWQFNDNFKLIEDVRLEKLKQLGI
jgi:hypothetical protein